MDQAKEDTQPRPPAGLRENIPAEWTAPISATNLVSQDALPGAPCLLSLAIMLVTSCMCILVIGLGGVAGYNDELDIIRTESAEEKAQNIVRQYDRAVAEQEQGSYDALLRALNRYEFIEREEPNYRDVPERLAQLNSLLDGLSAQYDQAMEEFGTEQYALAEQRLETILLDFPDYRDASFQLEQVRQARAQITTPLITETPATPDSAIPTLSSSPAVTASPTFTPIEDYFNQADRYMKALLYEEAIEYLEIVRGRDPAYRESEVIEMLHTAKSAQALIYIREQNTGANGLPGDQLARGVQLGSEALTLRNQYPWLAAGNMTNTDVYVAQQFLAAKRYVDAGRYDQAQPILNELCDINCGWGYGGTTVRELLNAAGGGSET